MVARVAAMQLAVPMQAIKDVQSGTRVAAMQLAVPMQAIKDVQSGTRILYVICAEGKANKNITIANLVSLQSCKLLVAIGSCGLESHLVLPYQTPGVNMFHLCISHTHPQSSQGMHAYLT